MTHSSTLVLQLNPMPNYAFEADAVRDGAPFPVVFVPRAAQRGVVRR